MALVIVMIVIAVLGILAAGFAYSMKVETKLARNSSYEPDLEWIGRSGAEFARYVLVQSMNVPSEPWDSLNQKWAGGPMGTNDVLINLSLEDNEIGAGRFSIKIIDLERKFNINLAHEEILRKGLDIIGAGLETGNNISTITDSFMDWIDPNDEPRLSGAESRDYMNNPNPGFPPYVSKNGPLDDIAELLMIRGITPELYGRAEKSEQQEPAGGGFGFGAPPASASGLVDLFTTFSSGTVNINTASASVLQLMPGLDAGLAQSIVMARSGLDGVDGTEDDVPFRSVGELINVPGMVPGIVQSLQGAFGTRSLTFEVRIVAEINQYRRQFIAVFRRNRVNPRDLQMLFFHWK